MKRIIVLALFIFFPFYNIFSQWNVIQNVSGFNTLNSIHFENSLTGWVAGDATSIYKSINGGANWTQQTSGLATGDYYSINFINTSIGWVVGTYTSTGAMGYIFRTTNGGTSWTQKLSASSHRFYTTFVWDTSTCWVAGTNNGTNAAIIKTVNSGNNWTTQLYDQYSTIKTIFFIDYMTGWAAGNNTILKTTTSGSSWSPITFAGDVRCICFTDVNTGWAGTGDGRLLKSTNGGNTWNQVFQAGTTNSISAISFPNIQMGYFTYGSMVFKTVNSGISWIPLETGSFNELYSISCPTSSDIYTSGWDGVVAYSNNGGGTYTMHTATFMRNNVNKPIIMNGFTYDTLMVNISKNPGAFILDLNVRIDTVINAIDSNLVFILSHNYIDDTIIYRAGGGGNNFIRTILNDSASISINSGLPPFTGSYKPSKPLSKFNYTSPSGPWILTIKESQTNVRTGVIKSWGITVTYNITISVNKISETVPTDFELMQNYPNPFNPITNIKFKLKEPRFTTLIIYDLLGRVVSTLVNEKLKAGEYETAFDGSALSSGIYFYKLTCNGGETFSETKKMLKIK